MGVSIGYRQGSRLLLWWVVYGSASDVAVIRVFAYGMIAGAIPRVKIEEWVECNMSTVNPSQ